MKPIWNKLLGILLGVFLAMGSWLEVHAPSIEGDILFSAPVPTSTQENKGNEEAVIGMTVTAVHQDQPAKIPTTIPEGLTPAPDGKTRNLLPATQPASCSDDVIGSGSFAWPTDNHSLSGNDYGPGHPGIDLAAGEGSPVYAADAGVVIALGNDTAGYGNLIEIDHHNGYLTLYAHLSVIGVSMCQSVQAGQWIGAAGSTGNASGTHLHFGVEKDGWAIDPWTVLP